MSSEKNNVTIDVMAETYRMNGKFSSGYGVDHSSSGNGVYREKEPYIAIVISLENKDDSQKIRQILEENEVIQRSEHSFSSFGEPKPNYNVNFGDDKFFVDVFDRDKAKAVIDAISKQYPAAKKDEGNIEQVFAELELAKGANANTGKSTYSGAFLS